MVLTNNYYFSSFFWNTIQKILAAIVGFVTVPLLLNYFGKEQYGVLSLATACNGYMHLLDLGMDVGAVRYFSLWRKQGNIDKINRVARTNITFYGIIAIINALFLLILAFYGESLFSLSHNQYLQFRLCLVILASFSIISWGATTFSQLLISDMQIGFIAKVQSVITILKLGLIWLALRLYLDLVTYFLFLTLIISSAIFPYIKNCLKCNLIGSVKPAIYWKDFKNVIMFSLSIFALSLFQMTATQTRPIILGIFADSGAIVNTEYRIIEVIPQFIIMIAGSFASIFLPKTTELYSKCNQTEINIFAYRWTTLTTIIGNILCFPFIIGAKEVLAAYVGSEYLYLYLWLMVWVFTTLLQTYSSPTYSLILASGNTKIIVYTSAVACIISVVVNILLAKSYGVGSAIIGYSMYIVLNMIGYYFFYYNRILGLSKMKVFRAFIKPTLCATVSLLSIQLLLEFFKPLDSFYIGNNRLIYLIFFTIKTVLWLFIYALLILATKVIVIKNKSIHTQFDSTI